MANQTDPLPIEETLAPEDQAAAVEAVRAACETRTPIYPIGGGTSLRFGLAPKTPGLGLVTTGLDRVIDYPARDMTITVEAGVTMAELARTLAAEGQRLPIDAPRAEQATLGGLIATNWSGPRRYGHGTIRDYVIGISAIDGRGISFKGGGRVVKNVAGYDFCKLLTGSLGTLGLITQITLKVKPLAERTALLACKVGLEQVESLLDGLVHSATTPTAIELLAGPAWRQDEMLKPSSESAATLVVGLEGSAPEVEWMTHQLAGELRSRGIDDIQTISDDAADEVWSRLVEWPAETGAPLVVKASMPPGRVAQFCIETRAAFPEVSLQAHAGNGIVLLRFDELPDDPAKLLISQLQPKVANWGGSAIVLEYMGEGELTRQAVWGGRRAAGEVMEAVKHQFDPHGLLNPGRFLYAM